MYVHTDKVLMVESEYIYILQLMRVFPECIGDFALVLLEEDDLLLDDELLRILGQEVPELLDVLAGDVTYLGRRLRTVPQQGLNGNLRTSTVLPEKYKLNT